MAWRGCPGLSKSAATVAADAMICCRGSRLSLGGYTGGCGGLLVDVVVAGPLIFVRVAWDGEVNRASASRYSA